jgi:hypothetical protein
MVATCPHCGSILERPLFTSPLKQAIYDFVLREGICTSKEIEDHVYKVPRQSNVIKCHIAQMRSTLEAHGLKIISTHGPGATYKIVEIKVPKCPSLIPSNPTPTV